MSGDSGLEGDTTAEIRPIEYVGRVSILALRLPSHSGEDGAQRKREVESIYRKTLAALRADPRVKELRAVSADDNSFRDLTLAAAGLEED